ncbi:MAG: trypsin-like serine protease [Archangium sp.]|nr:trypsin-like serine protease [Archangium sp.]
MRIASWALAAALVFTACGPVDETDEADQLVRYPTSSPQGALIKARRDGIVGGRVTWGYPQVFSILMEMADGSAGTCTSTLVGRRTLLTASHCVRSDDKRTSARYVDATNATVRRDNQTIRATAWIAHPDWLTATEADESNVDIALVQLEREPFVRPLQWNQEMLDLSWRTRLVEATGYGVESAQSNNSGTKRTIVIPIVSVASSTLVTGTNVPLSGTCFGDSGGPIFATFPDGQKRVIGVNSKTRMAECGPGTSTRPDANNQWVTDNVALYEAASCMADHECQTTGCATPDPDCLCLADGMCNAACNAPGTSDPDCPSSCAQDGVCAAVPCGLLGDFDCSPVSQPCGRDAHCNSRMCRESPQHPEPYCTMACDTNTPCINGLECNAGVCRFPILPTAAAGEVCTANSLCDGLDLVCVTIPSQGAEPTCRTRCLEADDCGKGKACVATTDSAIKACAPVVQLPAGKEVTLTPAACSVAPSLFALLALVPLMRRRRRQ